MNLILGDCLEKMRELPDNSVDSVVTDPPYGIGFMNKEWDNPAKHRELIEREKKRSEERFEEGKSPAKGGFSKGVQPGLPIGTAKEGRWFQEWCEEWGKECLRVLKPGGYLLSFSAPRTYHRMTTGFEDAGFEIRDQIMWVFGSGFPKSHNIGKAVDKLQGNDREVVGEVGDMFSKFVKHADRDWTPVSNERTKGTSEWEGWGTALKPAHEPICVARKPFKGNVAQNVLEWGTGGINIDESRVPGIDPANAKRIGKSYKTDESNLGNSYNLSNEKYRDNITVKVGGNLEGRWPANIIFDEEAGEILDQQSWIRKTGGVKTQVDNGSNQPINYGGGLTKQREASEGGASRYFLNIKVDTEDFFMYIYNTLNELLCGNILENQQVVTTLSGVIKEVEKYIVKQGQYTIGSLLMEQFQKDTISIISTLTELMTELKIYNSLQRVNTDFYTQELGKTINKLMELNTENVSVVETIKHLMDLTLEMVEHIKVIVKNVEELNYKNGGKQIENTTTNTTGNIEKGNSFFYCPKASKKDRDEGMDGFEEKHKQRMWAQSELSTNDYGSQVSSQPHKNNHPTVKPTELMLYLIKLVTPKGGMVLEPFMGSGSTGKACVRGGFDFIGIEKEEEYYNISKARIENEQTTT